MAYIYKITNLINNKLYIGKTLQSIQSRWSEHLRESSQERSFNRPLYRAIRKYGKENFTIEMLEEVSENTVNEREVFWINHYQTREKGYNATYGGDGRAYLDSEKIIEDYKVIKNMVTVAEINECSVSGVKDILTRSEISISSSAQTVRDTYGKKIDMLDKVTGDVILNFSTQKDAARYIMENKYSGISRLCGITTKIGQVCKGERVTFAGFKWRYSKV